MSEVQSSGTSLVALKEFNRFISNPKTAEYLESVLGEKKQSFVNNLVSLVSNSVALQACTPSSLMYAVMKATALGLPVDPNLGQAHFIPYKDNKTGVTNCQFQVSYKGITQLAIRSDKYKTINVTDVKEGEIIGMDRLTGVYQFKWLPDAERINAKTAGYVAYFELKSGFSKMFYMSIEELEKHAKTYSQTYKSKNDYVRNSSKWATDFDAMAKKTVMKLLLNKYGVLSVEMRDALIADQATINSQGQVDSYIDRPDEQETKAEVVAEKRAKMRAKQQEEVADATIIDDLPEGQLMSDEQ